MGSYIQKMSSPSIINDRQDPSKEQILQKEKCLPKRDGKHINSDTYSTQLYESSNKNAHISYIFEHESHFTTQNVSSYTSKPNSTLDREKKSNDANYEDNYSSESYYPFNCIGIVSAELNNELTFSTGFLISPNLIATSARSLYSIKTGQRQGEYRTPRQFCLQDTVNTRQTYQIDESFSINNEFLKQAYEIAFAEECIQQLEKQRHWHRQNIYQRLRNEMLEKLADKKKTGFKYDFVVLKLKTAAKDRRSLVLSEQRAPKNQRVTVSGYQIAKQGNKVHCIRIIDRTQLRQDEQHSLVLEEVKLKSMTGGAILYESAEGRWKFIGIYQGFRITQSLSWNTKITKDTILFAQ